MVELLVFVLVAYGATNIMVFGSLFDGWRNLCKRLNPGFMGKLFTCMMCLPYWWGVILSLVFYSPMLATGHIVDLELYSLTIPAKYIATFFDGCLASGVVWILHSFQEAMERHHDKGE